MLFGPLPDIVEKGCTCTFAFMLNVLIYIMNKSKKIYTLKLILIAALHLRQN